MNGLGNELRDRLLSLSAHAHVVSTAAHTPDWSSAQKAIARVAGVVGVAPYEELQALALRTPEMLPVTLRGIDPRAEPTVTDVLHSVTQGRLADLTGGSDRVIVGEVIA